MINIIAINNEDKAITIENMKKSMFLNVSSAYILFTTNADMIKNITDTITLIVRQTNKISIKFSLNYSSQSLLNLVIFLNV